MKRSLLLAMVVGLGVLISHAAALGSTLAVSPTVASTNAEELAATIIGEDLSLSFRMHVIRPTPAVQAAGALIGMRDEAVPALTRILGSVDPIHRKNAVYILNRIGTSLSVPPRVQALSDESPQVRAMAAHDLPVWSDDTARKAALGALKDREAAVRNAAVWAFDLRRLDRSAPAPDNRARHDAASAIVPLLDDPDTRLAAAKALASLGSDVASRPLAKALVDDRAGVRRELLNAIGALHDKSVTLEVLPLLKDKEGSVRAAAAAALGELEDIRATPALIQALTDSDAYVRSRAAKALGQIGDRRAVEPLIKALENGNHGAPMAAAEALGRIGDPAAVKPLMAVLRPDSPGAEAAATALGALRDPVAVEALRLYLMDNPESEPAAKALGQKHHPGSVAALISVAIERGSVVCRRALEPLTGHSFSYKARQVIEKWWAANRANYAS